MLFPTFLTRNFAQNFSAHSAWHDCFNTVFHECWQFPSVRHRYSTPDNVPILISILASRDILEGNLKIPFVLRLIKHNLRDGKEACEIQASSPHLGNSIDKSTIQENSGVSKGAKGASTRAAQKWAAIISVLVYNST